IIPTSAPFDGGTQLTICGWDFMLNSMGFQDTSILIGKNKCKIDVKNSSQNKLLCKVNQEATVNFNISSSVSNGKQTVNFTTFSFVNPVIAGITPSYGPQSGKTLLTLKGHYLNSGKDRKVYIGGDVCTIKSESSTAIECYTPGKIIDTYPVTLKIDNAHRKASTSFTYKEDPSIFKIEPTKSFLSGGSTITAHGRNLNAVASPKMVIQLSEPEKRYYM
ncbi:hypothetical protein AB205_0163070, partial [Aquarana catesbeiana]